MGARTPNPTTPLWKREVNFKLSWVGIIFLIATAGLIGLYAWRPTLRPTLTFGLAAVASEAGIVAAYYVGQGLRESARESSKVAEATARAENFNRTMVYTQRWGDPNLREARTAWRKIVNEHHGSPEDERRRAIRDQIASEPDVETSLIACMNLLEDLALAVHEEMVDEEVVFRFYATTVEWCWEALKPWVDDVRAKRGAKIYVELEKLYNSWQKATPAGGAEGGSGGR